MCYPVIPFTKSPVTRTPLFNGTVNKTLNRTRTFFFLFASLSFLLLFTKTYSSTKYDHIFIASRWFICFSQGNQKNWTDRMGQKAVLFIFLPAFSGNNSAISKNDYTFLPRFLTYKFWSSWDLIAIASIFRSIPNVVCLHTLTENCWQCASLYHPKHTVLFSAKSNLLSKDLSHFFNV